MNQAEYDWSYNRTGESRYVIAMCCRLSYILMVVLRSSSLDDNLTLLIISGECVLEFLKVAGWVYFPGHFILLERFENLVAFLWYDTLSIITPVCLITRHQPLAYTCYLGRKLGTIFTSIDQRATGLELEYPKPKFGSLHSCSGGFERYHRPVLEG